MKFGQTLARATLFGHKKNEISLARTSWVSLRRLLGADMKDQPGLMRYMGNLFWSLFTQQSDRLPKGWPSEVFAIAAREIAEKGGVIKLQEGQVIPAFVLQASSAQVLPHQWIVLIKGTADYNKVEHLGDAIKEALAQKGHKMSVRVVPYPLRVEIDRPNAQKVYLSDVWEFLKQQPVNQYEYLTGFYYNSGLQLNLFQLTDSREWSGIIAGASGSGKSQWSLSMLLSLALNTSPELLTMIIGDPKAADLIALNKLPHLSNGGILTNVDEIREVVKAVEAEMDRRIKVGDKSIVKKRIFLFLDEWADISQLDKSGEIEQSIIRLGLKGRFWGINVFLASQKTTSDVLSTLVLANLMVRACLRVGSFNEAKWVAGQDGCYSHKLPGNGALLIYNPEYTDGLRAQGFFVGKPEDANYDEIVGQYVGDIRERWANVQPHWQITSSVKIEESDEFDSEYAASDSAPVEKKRGRPSNDLSDEFWNALYDEMERNNDSITVYGVRKVYRSIYDKVLSYERAKQIHSDVTAIN